MPPNLSRERRRHVERLLQRTGVLYDSRLSEHAKLVYIVGALIADDTGLVLKADLEAIEPDSEVVQVARTILTKMRGGWN